MPRLPGSSDTGHSRGAVPALEPWTGSRLMTGTGWPDRDSAVIAGGYTKSPGRTRPKRRARSKETPEYRAFLSRALAGYARRVGELGDPSDLADFRTLRREVEDALDVAVRGLHARGFSWTEVGDAIGWPRQDAWRRWHQ